MKLNGRRVSRLCVVLCLVVLAVWYASFFRGASASYTTDAQTTWRLGINEVGRFHAQRGRNLPGATRGLSTGTYEMGSIENFGFPGFESDVYQGAAVSYATVRVPLWLVLVPLAAYPTIRLGLRWSKRRRPKAEQLAGHA